MTHQHTKAEPLAVPQLTVLLQAHAKLRLNPAVLSYPQLYRETWPTHYTLTWSFMVTLLLMSRTAIRTYCCWHKVLIIKLELYLMNLKENLTEVKCGLSLSPFWCTSLRGKKKQIRVFRYKLHKTMKENSALWCFWTIFDILWNCSSANFIWKFAYQFNILPHGPQSWITCIAIYSECLPRAEPTQIYWNTTELIKQIKYFFNNPDSFICLSSMPLIIIHLKHNYLLSQSIVTYSMQINTKAMLGCISVEEMKW